MLNINNAEEVVTSDLEYICLNLQEELLDISGKRLLKMCDMVYSGPTTSAAIDAYCFELPIVTQLDGKTLNMSLLRGG